GISDIRLRVHIMPVRDTRPHHSSLEAIGLCDRPRGQEASIAPAANGNPLAIYQAFSDQVFDAVQDILEILAAHVANHCVGKSRPMSPTAAHIRFKHCIACRCEYLREAIPEITLCP